MEFIRRLPPAFLRGVQIGYEQRAWMRYFQGDLSGALSEFDALIKRDRKTGLYSRADFFKEIREYGRAIADYDELTRLLPDNGTVYYNRGEAWAQKAYQAYNDPQLFDQAFSDLAKAMNMEPKWTQAWAYLTRGNIETHLEQHDKALADWNEAVRLVPATEKMRLLVNRAGELWGRRGDFDRARADSDEAMRLDPK